MTKNSGAQIKLTHPNKIIYPEDHISKEEFALYYASIEKWILPYITNRPLTVVRCPQDYHHCFYQKHINVTTPPQLKGIVIKEKEKKAEYIYIDDSAGLFALVQMGCLELHPWGSTIKKVDHPDIIIFDLDPAPDVPWKNIVSTAFAVKKYLAELKLQSFVKTTGGKGLHIVIPIKPEFTWTEIKNYAHAFVDLMVSEYPNKYIDTMAKAKRKGKIFIDYLRNVRGATAIAPYSTRARAHAPIATPIHWDELSNHFKDTFFTLKTLPKRLQNLQVDPWQDFFKIKQRVKI
jgi:bifunctional non-homologous end joining protein LigD